MATGTISVNFLAASPFTVAVGGTKFNEGSGNYWNPSTMSLETALSYIPEVVWNDSCKSGSCPSGVSANIAAGGGGSSTFYQKPPWQTVVQGIPMEGARDLPDVSLNASGSHDPYVICLHLSCSPNAQGEIELYLIGGTSASAPSFAGIMALVDQKAGGRQGQANYVLYTLAAKETLAQCNGSSQTALPASTCIFNDVTVGNNAVPGETGYGSAGASYQSGVGYDLATGLGSVNVSNLVNGWANARSQATQISSFTLMPTSNIQHGTTPVSFSVTVAPQMGMGTPTGDVSLMAEQPGGGTPTPVTFATLSNGSTSGMSHLFPGGTYNVVAHYSGDGTFLPSDSTPAQVTVTPEASTTVVSAFQGAIGNPMPVTTLPYGAPFSILATVSSQSGNGTPTGYVDFLIDGAIANGNDFLMSASGQAVLPAGDFVFRSPGQHAISAVYNGDPSFMSSTSAAVGVQITQALTQISLQSSTNTGLAGQPVTLTATVIANSSGNAPSGTVNFTSGTTALGSALLSGTSSAAGSVTATAVLMTSQLPNGSDSITAQYAGDTNYLGSSSAPVQVAVSGTFLVTASPLTIVVPSPGQTGSTTLMFQSAAGFNGTATLSSTACSNLPLESMCTFSPSNVSFNGMATTVPVMLTLNTTAPTPAASPVRRPAPGLRMGPRGMALIWGLVLAFLLLSLRRRGRSVALASLAFAAIVMASNCGGGGSGGAGGGGGNHGDPGTLPGFYSGVTVTVTINGATQSITNLTVQVE